MSCNNRSNPPLFFLLAFVFLFFLFTSSTATPSSATSHSLSLSISGNWLIKDFVFLFSFFFVLRLYFQWKSLNLCMFFWVIRVTFLVNVDDVVGERENDGVLVSWKARRHLAEEGNTTSSLILAAKRTRRRDPLDNSKFYTSGYNISNKHYWAVSSFSLFF